MFNFLGFGGGLLNFRLRCGEVDGVDGASWANLGALAASFAFGWVDVGQVASHLDGFEGAFLQALLASNAAGGAVFDDQGTLVGVGAANVDATVILATGTDFDDATGAGLGANAATDAFVGIHDGKTGLWVDVQSAEVTLLDAVAKSHAAFGAAALASIKSACESADVSAFVMHLGRRVLATAVAAYHSDFGFEGTGGETEYGGHLVHVGTRAGQAVDVAFLGGLFHTSLSQGATSGKTTTAAVGTWQAGFSLVDERVFLDFELLGHDVKDDRQHGTQNTENHEGNK